MVLAYSSLTTACIISLKLDMVKSLIVEGTIFFKILGSPSHVNFWFE